MRRKALEANDSDEEGGLERGGLRDETEGSRG